MKRGAGKGVIKIERIGGFAGFGGPSHLRSEGEIDLDSLPPAQRDALNKLLAGKGREPHGLTGGDLFRYVLTWEEDGHRRTVELGEEDAPDFLRSAVTDRLV